MVQNLDDVDRKILRELQMDGRASFRDISSRIGVSTPTVSARVKAMTDVGLIRGYSTVLDADMLGQASVVVAVEAKPSDVEKVYSKLVGDDMVRQLYVLSDSRIMMMVSYYNQVKYKEFIESLSKIPEITNVTTSMVIKTPKEAQRAALTDEAGLLIRCYYCGHLIRDEGVRLRIDDKYHYMCCDVCAKLYKEKYDKLKKSA
ncbi:MAG: AsnC family transcriptional regulator [Thermoplasmata archaeon]